MTDLQSRMPMTNIIGATIQHNDQKDPQSYIPEIIEETRNDSNGKSDCCKYIRGKLLGKGGFGRCYVGTTVSTKTPYALKIVPKISLVKSKAKQKLQSEIKIHRNLRHVNIVRFEKYFEDIHNVYIVLELCSNNSMSELLKRRKKLLEPEVRFYLHQLVESLKYLHQALVIHRDLKLGNLFLDSQLRVKVGDFGLAAKLSHVDERKRTVCGTPNYLAPEILEGKDGHSFEVDIWSTGVVMYTLLIGKPPFESKDMKSTYKRILANSYSFPDHTPISEDAKGLIRLMLQHRPERRPSLDEILDHAFFTSPTNHHPKALPECALRETPSLPIMSAGAKPLSSAPFSYEKNKNLANALLKTTDENDAGAINRAMPIGDSDHPSSSNVKNTLGRILRSTTAALNENKVGHKTVSAKPASGTVQTITASTLLAATNDYEDENGPKHYANGQRRLSKPFQSTNLPSHPQGSRVDKSKLSGERPSSSTRSVHQIQANIPVTKHSRLQPSVANHTSTAKFDVYDDIVHAQSTPGQGEKASPKNRIGRDDSKRCNLNAKRNGVSYENRQLNLETNGDNDDSIDQVAEEVEALKIDTNFGKAKQNTSINNSNGLRSSTKSPTTKRSLHPTVTSKLTIDIQTPPPQSLKQQKGTLEEMHEMLDKSYINNINIQTLGKEGIKDCILDPILGSKEANSNTTPKVWVVRYVDYTSKYGLGFLLNTGSAGVYFNDSTKIVLSSDGTLFQYIERVKKAKEGNEANPSCESYQVQSHLLTAYPVELQKKVTLLRHFRNYLIEQQKLCSNQNEDHDQEVRLENVYGGPTGGDEVQSLPMLQDIGGVSGANAMIKFGISSAKCHNPLVKDENNIHDEIDLPYVKKWVRTKHAILFRMSNRTVQVLFFDRSEILLSSEAHIVTYVNKQSVRSEHSLEEVMQSGRTDIAKRLRYTKDIMYRLIHLQSK